MSHKQAIYAAYLENFKQHHPNVVEPTYLSTYEEVKAVVADARKNGQKFTHSTKALENNMPEGSYLMPSGQVVEVAISENGMFTFACIHANRENYERYARPMSMNMYWNG